MSMLNHFFDYKPEVLALDEKALELCQPYFKQMEDIRDYNQLKMLKAFADTQMSSTDMLGTTGYGLWDSGRAKLEQIFAEVMGAEDALVRSQFQSGTHTLAVALFGLLRAGDTLLAATGRPYDTLEGVIGLDGKGKGTGTLMDYGIKYDEAPLKADFTPDYELIAQKAPGAKVCHIQRSRGYLQRNAFDLATIRRVADTARAANPDIIVFVDNCYGEFTQKEEPCQAGADLVVGSLIKNPGGGIAPTGGYIAGRKDLVELCAYRLNAPGLGKELGCTLETPRDMYLGFYYAPGVVCEAIKTAIYAQCPDSQGLGLAISNRLKKAAGFKTIAAGQKRVVIGITGGTGDGTFSPNATCTRAQSVTFLYRALGTAPTTANGFTDVAANAFYTDAVAWAVENGVTNGTTDSTFSPDNGCTRAQIVTFLFRAYQGK